MLMSSLYGKALCKYFILLSNQNYASVNYMHIFGLFTSVHGTANLLGEIKGIRSPYRLRI